jgi:hypothetical protein
MNNITNNYTIIIEMFKIKSQVQTWLYCHLLYNDSTMISNCIKNNFCTYIITPLFERYLRNNYKIFNNYVKQYRDNL